MTAKDNQGDGQQQQRSKGVNTFNKAPSTSEDDGHGDSSSSKLLDVYSEQKVSDGKPVLSISIDKDSKTRVSAETKNALMRKNPGSFVLDSGNVIDSGAACSITPKGPRVSNVQDIIPFLIKGVAGRPITIKQKCSLSIHYTDFKGKERRFVLHNCYLCDAIRVPLLSASHLIAKGCELHLTQRGHGIKFPDGTGSEVVVQSDGLIGLLPCDAKKLLSQMKITPTNEATINKVIMNERVSSSEFCHDDVMQGEVDVKRNSSKEMYVGSMSEDEKIENANAGSWYNPSNHSAIKNRN